MLDAAASIMLDVDWAEFEAFRTPEAAGVVCGIVRRVSEFVEVDTMDVGFVARGVIIGGNGARSWCLHVNGGN